MIDDTPEPADDTPRRKAAARTEKAETAAAADRDDRLKAALRANLARRKAQTRARRAATDPKD